MDTLKIGFIGLGLIGGSIAKALRASIPDLWITVYDKNKDTLIQAKEDGIANETVPAINASFSGCHYIFLCAPVSGNAENLIQLKEFLFRESLNVRYILLQIFWKLVLYNFP